MTFREALAVGEELLKKDGIHLARRLSGGGASNMGYALHVPKGESEDLTITSGTQGLSRHDLVVAEFKRGSSTTADKLDFKVVTGTASAAPADPALVTGDLISSGSVNQVPLFRVIISGTTLSSIEQVAPTLGGAQRNLFVCADEPAVAYEGDIWFVTG